MNESHLQILNAIPLTEVMRGWGHAPYSDGEKAATYHCAWHHPDIHPSLVVDKQVRTGATDLGFKCFTCGHEGYGAVQLAAQLMGLPGGPVPAPELERVMNELASRCDVKLPKEDGEKKFIDHLRTSLTGWNEFCKQEPQYADMQDGDARFEAGEWTEECLKALGLKVELATRRAKKGDTEGTNAAIIRIGDTITDFDPDSGEALYRCSFGRDFYRGAKAETRTIAQWGAEVEKIFGVKPVSRFLQRIKPDPKKKGLGDEPKKQGGAVVRIVRATKNYPIFMFRYAWGTKKYEPKDIYGTNKWTWWDVREDADLYHRWYADSILTDALEGAMPEQDDRHKFEFEKDKEGRETHKVRFNRVVLCSGPRDAIAVWSHSNAHVVWLHSEQAGFDKVGGNTRPNRWLRGFIKKLLDVTVEGGLYVCYDEDATGLAASQAIALNNPQVRWLRLPKELGQVQVSSSWASQAAKPSAKFQVSSNAAKPETLNLKPETKVKPLKDVTDFVTHFSEVEGRMPAEVQHDDPVEWFDNALFDTPTCKFWQYESSRKDADGTARNRYKFDLRNTPVFLRARGMVRRVMQDGKETYSRYFLMGNDNIYTEIFPGAKSNSRLVAQARDLMAEWLRAHKECNDPKGALSRAIFSAKLEQSVMDSIEQMDFDDKSFGEDYDYFFFKNTAVRVSKDEIKTVPYNQMKYWTNSEAILDGNFSVQQQAWHVIVNPIYASELEKHEEILLTAATKEEREQENMRWDSWASMWHYLLKLDKPLEEMPVHFRFLYNTCRIFWDKEVAGQELSTTEKQVQDMYFIAMLHALGSALVRHRSANRQQFVHITDNGTRREDLASGGTGKTAILELLGLMRRVLNIDGKSLEGGNIVLEQELGKVVPGIHNIVCLDELPEKFSAKKMYNYPLSVTSRGLYEGSIKLTGDDLPKFVVASNEQIDLSSDSTLRRDYQVLVSDWYHPRSIDGSRPAHTPADDFRKEGMKEVARNLSNKLLTEARNLMLGCVQLFFQLPDETIRPPKDSRALLRQALAASKDEQFTRWIAGYLSDPRHIGIPIAKREFAISLLDYCATTIGEKTIKGAYKRIRDNLDDYLRTSIYIKNPPVVLRTPTDRDKGYRRCAAWQHPKGADGYSIPTDKDGNRLPRVLDKSNQTETYYFYRKSRVPRNFYDEAHQGDPDYVQGAPETDPEAETKHNE